MKPIEINIFYILHVIQKNRNPLLIINLTFIAVSIVVVFLLPVYYESKVVFYPYSPESSDPRIMLNPEASFSVFSDVDQSERYILIGKSQRIKEILIERYDLYARYGIEKGTEKAKFKIMLELQDNLNIRKLENGSVAVSAFDFSRDTAAMMANDVVAEIEKIVDEATREKNQKIYTVFENQYSYMSQYVASLKDSIVWNQKNKNTQNVLALQKQLEFAMEEFTKTKVRYEQAKTISLNDLKSILIVEPAQPAYKKARPKRMIIVGIVAILSTLLSISGFALVDYIKSEGKQNT